MKKYMDFDSGEIWTLSELEKAFDEQRGELENYENFEEYFDHMISLGMQKIGGLVEVDEEEA